MQRRNNKRKYSGADPTSWKKFKYTPKPTATASLTAKVNKLIRGQEKKYFDVTGAVTTVAGTPDIIPLTNIGAGDDGNTRDGRNVSYSSAQMRAVLSTGDALTSVAPFRCIVLYDSQPNLSPPAGLDVLEDPAKIHSPLAMRCRERFRVVYDNFTALYKGDYPVTTTLNAVPLQYFYKCAADTSVASWVSTTASNPQTGAYVLFLLTDAAMEFKYYHRMRFTDS